MTEATLTISVDLYNTLMIKATAFDFIVEMAQDEDMDYRIVDFCKFVARRQEEE